MNQSSSAQNFSESAPNVILPLTRNASSIQRRGILWKGARRLLWSGAVFTFFLCGPVVAPSVAAENFFELSAKSITGEEVPFANYRGKVVLVVNIASQCGFTSQLGDLEKLYEEYKDRGFVVLGFPSNDFGEQEPLSNPEVKRFCQGQYGVTFPLFEKGIVSGTEKQPVYQFITKGPENAIHGDPGWNFTKYLIGKDGKVKARFMSMIKPLSGSVKRKIEELLAEQ